MDEGAADLLTDIQHAVIDGRPDKVVFAKLGEAMARLVGFKVEGRGIARHDYPVAVEGETVGTVTSGTLSPTLGEAIGLALVAPDVEDEFEVVIRNRPVAARTVPLPFYKRDKK